MVGRPRTKAKQVQALAEQQYALNDRLFAECPPMYLDGTDRHDPLAQCWRSAIEAAADIRWDSRQQASFRRAASSADSRLTSNSRSRLKSKLGRFLGAVACIRASSAIIAVLLLTFVLGGP